jgi:hypothetical protein
MPLPFRGRSGERECGAAAAASAGAAAAADTAAAAAILRQKRASEVAVGGRPPKPPPALGHARRLPTSSNYRPVSWHLYIRKTATLSAST